MVPRNELQAMLRGAKEKAEAVEQRHVQERVDTYSKVAPTYLAPINADQLPCNGGPQRQN